MLCECSGAIDHVVLELAFVGVSISEEYFPVSVLLFILELTLVRDPILLNSVKFLVVQVLVKLFRLLVVKLTPSVKLIIPPNSLVCDLATLIVQFAESIHFVVFPVAFVHATILEDKLTLTMPLVSQFSPFVC